MSSGGAVYGTVVIVMVHIIQHFLASPKAGDSLVNESAARMDSGNALAATIGVLIGYLSAEVASIGTFERLLWPQRHYHSTRFGSLFKAALLMPTGGVLHKATLQAFDIFQKNGLIFQRNRGHMLGSPFYPDSRYKFMEPDSAGDAECRNGFWSQVLGYCSRTFRPAIVASSAGKPSRSVQTVTLLNLAYGPYKPSALKATIPLSDETGSVHARSVVSIIAGEGIGIIVGIAVGLSFRSCYCLLWFMPLVVKLLSACFAIHREALHLDLSPEDANNIAASRLYHPTNGFMVIRGPEKVLQQFSRHYGHPIRNRTRELIQMGFILFLNLLFPIGMVCLIWMPIPVQITWLGYQLYIAVAMHGYRYFGGDICCSIQQSLGDALLIDDGAQVALAIEGGNALIATLSITTVDSVTEGRAVMARLVSPKSAE